MGDHPQGRSFLCSAYSTLNCRIIDDSFAGSNKKRHAWTRATEIASKLDILRLSPASKETEKWQASSNTRPGKLLSGTKTKSEGRTSWMRSRRDFCRRRTRRNVLHGPSRR